MYCRLLDGGCTSESDRRIAGDSQVEGALLSRRKRATWLELDHDVNKIQALCGEAYHLMRADMVWTGSKMRVVSAGVAFGIDSQTSNILLQNALQTRPSR